MIEGGKITNIQRKSVFAKKGSKIGHHWDCVSLKNLTLMCSFSFSQNQKFFDFLWWRNQHEKNFTNSKNLFPFFKGSSFEGSGHQRNSFVTDDEDYDDLDNDTEDEEDDDDEEDEEDEEASGKHILIDC